MIKQLKRYDASHPMLVAKSGDPARGAWLPKEREKPRKRPRKR